MRDRFTHGSAYEGSMARPSFFILRPQTSPSKPTPLPCKERGSQKGFPPPRLGEGVRGRGFPDAPPQAETAPHCLEEVTRVPAGVQPVEQKAYTRGRGTGVQTGQGRRRPMRSRTPGGGVSGLDLNYFATRRKTIA